jgi:hypothetical protein
MTGFTCDCVYIAGTSDVAIPRKTNTQQNTFAQRNIRSLNQSSPAKIGAGATPTKWCSSPHRVRETAGTEHKKHKRHKTEGRTLTFALFVFRSCLFPPTAKSAVKLNHGGELLLSQAGQGQLALKEVSLGIKNLEIALDTAAIAHFR